MLTDTKIAAIKPPASGQSEYPDHKVTGLRLRVGAGGKKTWTLRRRVGDKTINRKLGNYPAMGLASARVAADKAIAALEREGSVESLDRTFGNLAETWIEKVSKPKNDSWRLQERQLERHVLPHWKDKRLVQFRRTDVRELIDGIEGQILPNRVLALIKTIFRWAVSRDWLDASPAEGVERTKEETARDRVLSMPEIAKVWSASDLLGYPFGQFVKLLILTAQRRTEVASARWADIDLEGAAWVLRAEDTKAERTHLIPLTEAVRKILEGLPRLLKPECPMSCCDRKLIIIF